VAMSQLASLDAAAVHADELHGTAQQVAHSPYVLIPNSRDLVARFRGILVEEETAIWHAYRAVKFSAGSAR
jgi:hypothetical protein